MRTIAFWHVTGTTSPLRRTDRSRHVTRACLSTVCAITVRTGTAATRLPARAVSDSSVAAALPVLRRCRRRPVSRPVRAGVRPATAARRREQLAFL